MGMTGSFTIPATGKLYFDANGSFGMSFPVHFATLHEGLSLSASDFQVI